MNETDYETISRDFEIIVNRKTVVHDVSELKKNLQKHLNDGLRFRSYWNWIEHTSANPTGRLQTANKLQALVGDLFCRLNESTGTFFVNDSGLNFCLLNHLVNKKLVERNFERVLSPELIQASYYVAEQVDMDVAKILRAQIYKTKRLTREQIELRDYVLNLIREDLAELKVRDLTYVYESDYLQQCERFFNSITSSQEKSTEYSKQFTLTDEGFFFENLRLTTQDYTPLYAFTDAIYRLAVNEKHARSAIVLGPGNVSANAITERLTKRKWGVLVTPVIRNQGRKISKRNQVDVSFKALCDYLKNRDNPYGIIKLWYYNRVNHAILDIEELKKEVNVSYFAKLLATDVVTDQNVDLRCLDAELPASEQSLLQLWSQIIDVIYHINKSLNANKIVKLFERFYSLKRKCTDLRVLKIHDRLLKALQLKLGF